MNKTLRQWLTSAALASTLLSGCYGTYGPDGAQPYGAAGTGAVLPTQGQEIQHDYGRSCVIQCNGKDYFANCPNEARAVCQCQATPYAACK